VEFSSLLILLVAGCAVGLAAGYFAFDMGILLVPVLLLWYRSAHVSFLVSPYLAVGSALVVAMLAAAEGTYRDHRAGFVLWNHAVPLAIAGVLGAVAGALAVHSLSGETMMRLFALAVFAAAVQQFGTRRKPKDTGSSQDVDTVKLAAFGVLAGLVSAFTSTGNKQAAQPLLYKLLRVPLRRSVGTANASSMVFFLAAGTGLLFVGRGALLLPSTAVGYIDFGPLLPLALGAVACVHAGARLRERSPSRNADLVCGILLTALAVKFLVAP
jgi:uncharacterized membrane protein YfcA